MRLHWTTWLWSGFLGFNLLLGLTAYLMRDNLFLFLIKPSIPFQVDEPPTVPDYSDAAAWAIRPQSEAGTKAADIFFIHPTTAFSGADGWNADIKDNVARTRLEQVALPNHAMPFETSGSLWAPRYRQAVLFATLSAREDSREALSLAYGDVERAFDGFIASRDPNRPFFIVGSEQGALHGARLMLSRPKAMNRLVAAYLLEWPMAAQAGLPPACESRNQTGCLINYKTLDAGDERGRYLIEERSINWTKTDGYTQGKDRFGLCVNPLTGSAKAPAAAASDNAGSAAASGLETSMAPALLPGETGARCEDGGLIVEVNRPAALSRDRFTLGARYKLTAYNLFYSALGQDAQARIKAWPTSQTAP